MSRKKVRKSDRVERPEWKLTIWNQAFVPAECSLPPMSNQEVTEARDFLRKNKYPKPTDCPQSECPDWRPACKLGVCRIAVGMCGDF